MSSREVHPSPPQYAKAVCPATQAGSVTEDCGTPRNPNAVLLECTITPPAPRSDAAAASDTASTSAPAAAASAASAPTAALLHLRPQLYLHPILLHLRNLAQLLLLLLLLLVRHREQTSQLIMTLMMLMITWTRLTILKMGLITEPLIWRISS